MVAVSGAGNMAAVAEARKKKKMVRVNQAYIDGILKVYPFKPFPLDPEEIDKTMSDPKKKELLRSMTAEVVATVKAIRAKDEAVIKQYYAKGYAEEEVSDDDLDDELEGPSDAQRQQENNNPATIVVSSEETSASELCSSLSKL